MGASQRAHTAHETGVRSLLSARAVATSNGLIGCYSADERLLVATAWEPYQNLFQGIISCLHADPMIGGLAAGETARGRWGHEAATRYILYREEENH
jgi:hypothetical protein